MLANCCISYLKIDILVTSFLGGVWGILSLAKREKIMYYNEVKSWSIESFLLWRL